MSKAKMLLKPRIINWYSQDILKDPKLLLSRFFDKCTNRKDVFAYFSSLDAAKQLLIGKLLLKLRKDISNAPAEISFLNRDGSVKKGKEAVFARNLQILANDYYLLEGLDELFTKFQAQREYTKLSEYIIQKVDQATQNKLFSLLKDSKGSTSVSYTSDTRNYAMIAGYGVKLEGEFQGIKKLLEEKAKLEKQLPQLKSDAENPQLKEVVSGLPAILKKHEARLEETKKALEKNESRIKYEVFAQIYRVYESFSAWREKGASRKDIIDLKLSEQWVNVSLPHEHDPWVIVEKAELPSTLGDSTAKQEGPTHSPIPTRIAEPTLTGLLCALFK